MENAIVMPLGTRCTGAIVLIDKFDLRKAGYPFDWVDTNLTAIHNLLLLDAENIESHIINYFDQVQTNTQRHPDGTWFPHDIVKKNESDDLGQIMIKVRERYIRRFKRMHEDFQSGKDFVFLTVFAHLDPDYSIQRIQQYSLVMDLLMKMVKGNMKFITVNLTGNEVIDFNSPHVSIRTLVVPFQNDWDKFDEDIANRLCTDPFSEPHFKKYRV